MSRRSRRPRAVTALLLAPTTAWYLLLLLAPLAILVIFSLGERSPVGGYLPGLSLDNYARLPTRATAFANTFALAAVSTGLCALIGYPLAYYLATRAGSKRTILLVLVVLPFLTSFLIRTYAWFTILGANGLPAVAAALGVEPKPVLLNTHLAVFVGIVYNYLSLMVFPIYVSLERLDKRLLEASKDLGAGRWATFRQVTLPLSAPGLVSGGLLVFIPMMGEYIVPALLGGGKVFFVGNALVDLFLQSRNWPFGSAMAIGLIVVVLISVTAYLRIAARGRVERETSLL
ncbi:MAG TPA: ABC transporter permease [Candidatus Limnocylindrales bacterium]|nr:ABC transporter permease [Candidatus Limnocylindrales bacterium]